MEPSFLEKLETLSNRLDDLNEAAFRKELNQLDEEINEKGVQLLLSDKGELIRAHRILSNLPERIQGRFGKDLAEVVHRTAEKIMPVPELPKETWGEIFARAEPESLGRMAIDKMTRTLSDAEKQKRVESGEVDVRVFGCRNIKQAIQCIKERQLSRADLSEFYPKYKDVKQLIRDCPHLIELILSREYDLIPPEIGDLKNLKKLSCFGPLPPEIGQLTQLVELRVTDREPLPPEIGNLQSLKFLHLNSVISHGLPQEFSRLQNLKTLILEDTHPQPVVFQLKQLETLVLSCRELLPDIQNLTNLKVLDLCGVIKSWDIIGNPGLSALPSEIGALQNLTQLNLRSTDIRTLPDSIGNLRNLTDLNIQGTLVRKLPESFAHLEQLKRLCLSFNPNLVLKNLEQVEIFGRKFAPEALQVERKKIEPEEFRQKLREIIPFLKERVNEWYRYERNGAFLGQLQDIHRGLDWLETEQDLPKILENLPLLFHECAKLEFSQEFQDQLRNLSDLMDQLEE